MKNNKLYIIFVILTIVCFFSLAAIANGCGCRLIPIEEKTDVEKTEDSKEAELAREEGKDSTGEEQEEETAGEDKETEKETEEETNEENGIEEEQIEEEAQQQGQPEAPAITLEIYEGPIYSSSDDVCY
jgi:hypothetical protein